MAQSAPSPPIDAHHALVAEALDGDLSAFEVLYRDNVGRIHALAMRMCASPAFAEEMTQEVFVRAWRKLHLFRGQSKFSTWLHRLAVNAILDGMRRESRLSERDREPELVITNVRYIHIKRMDLDNAIALLPTGARQVFVLHDIEGFKHEEIGELLGITAGTARGQLHRARKLLRETLGR